MSLLVGPDTETVVALHLSEKNNRPGVCVRTLAAAVGAEVLETFTGAQLEGFTYEPIFGFFPDLRNAYQVLIADYVTTEDDINSAMREIRMALLEADVNYKVVKEFVGRCKEQCMTADVLESLSPAQNVK